MNHLKQLNRDQEMLPTRTGFMTSAANFSQVAGTTIQSGFSEVPSEPVANPPATSGGVDTLDELMRSFQATKDAPAMVAAIHYEN